MGAWVPVGVAPPRLHHVAVHQTVVHVIILVVLYLTRTVVTLQLPA